MLLRIAAVARYAGSRRGCRPRTASSLDPGLRGLALGYMLPPATRVGEVNRERAPRATPTQGCADLPWATCFRPLRGLGRLIAKRAPRATPTQGCADLPWATCFRPLRGLGRLIANAHRARHRPRAARTCPGLHASARYAGLGGQSQTRTARNTDPGLRGLALGYTLPPATRVAISTGLPAARVR